MGAAAKAPGAPGGPGASTGEQGARLRVRHRAFLRHVRRVRARVPRVRHRRSRRVLRETDAPRARLRVHAGRGRPPRPLRPRRGELQLSSHRRRHARGGARVGQGRPLGPGDLPSHRSHRPPGRPLPASASLPHPRAGRPPAARGGIRRHRRPPPGGETHRCGSLVHAFHSRQPHLQRPRRRRMREVDSAGDKGRAALYWLGLTLLSVLFLIDGAWLAQRLVTWTDESAYVHLGYLSASGRISLFQDEMPGSRMPLPFLINGWSQLAFGRSLLAARLTSLGIGVAVVWLTASLGRRIAGDAGGLLSAAFLVSQGVIVGYFATGTYHTVAATILLGGLALAIAGTRPWHRVAAAMALSLLFLTRTNLWPILPAAA